MTSQDTILLEDLLPEGILDNLSRLATNVGVQYANTASKARQAKQGVKQGLKGVERSFRQAAGMEEERYKGMSVDQKKALKRYEDHATVVLNLFDEFGHFGAVVGKMRWDKAAQKVTGSLNLSGFNMDETELKAIISSKKKPSVKLEQAAIDANRKERGKEFLGKLVDQLNKMADDGYDVKLKVDGENITLTYDMGPDLEKVLQAYEVQGSNLRRDPDSADDRSGMNDDQLWEELKKDKVQVDKLTEDEVQRILAAKSSPILDDYSTDNVSDALNDLRTLLFFSKDGWEKSEAQHIANGFARKGVDFEPLLAKITDIDQLKKIVQHYGEAPPDDDAALRSLIRREVDERRTDYNNPDERDAKDGTSKFRAYVKGQMDLDGVSTKDLMDMIEAVTGQRPKLNAEPAKMKQQLKILKAKETGEFDTMDPKEIIDSILSGAVSRQEVVKGANATRMAALVRALGPEYTPTSNNANGLKRQFAAGLSKLAKGQSKPGNRGDVFARRGMSAYDLIEALADDEIEVEDLLEGEIAKIYKNIPRDDKLHKQIEGLGDAILRSLTKAAVDQGVLKLEDAKPRELFAYIKATDPKKKPRSLKPKELLQIAKELQGKGASLDLSVYQDRVVKAMTKKMKDAGKSPLPGDTMKEFAKTAFEVFVSSNDADAISKMDDDAIVDQVARMALKPLGIKDSS